MQICFNSFLEIFRQSVKLPLPKADMLFHLPSPSEACQEQHVLFLEELDRGGKNADMDAE